MNRDTEIRLIKECVELHDRGETQYQEDAQSHSTERYVSEEWFAKEKSKLFLGMPT